ncbi:hypothetical protein [Streptomyces sp. NPDC090022]|uniref:hypothetical protein n=1 Tax=Streptomyces sp. NPDC090022 TaxID=3365920 RepID=UPI00382CF0DD
MAAYALRAWPPGTVPPELRDTLARAAAREPVDGIREAMREALAVGDCWARGPVRPIRR